MYKQITIIFCLIFILTNSFMVTASAKGLQDQVDQAISIIKRFEEIPEKSIPSSVLKDARGIAFLTVLKGGFIFSGRVGQGVVLARTGKSWSGPSAIGTGGAGFGLQIGGQVTEFVLILNTDAAVKAFSQGGNITFGADLSVSAGPVGRNAEAAVTPFAAVYSYSQSQGIFAGVSLEGTVIVSLSKSNKEYYGKEVKPVDILSGKIKPPAGANPLIKILSKY